VGGGQVIDRGEIVFADQADVLREDDEVRQRYLGI
jgi:ABC-type branched-subunit amino acid transport system ATPase component